MEIFCLVILQKTKISREELNSYEITYSEAIEYIKVNKINFLKNNNKKKKSIF